MKVKSIVSVLALASFAANAQLGPVVTSWSLNTTNATGYNNIISNVQQVQYSTNNVYVSCSCIPGYAIGPWGGNPNVPSNQNFVYKITRNPQPNTGSLTAIGLGHTGVWINGVSVFNVSDAMSYNNQGVWYRNAYFWEGQGFDNCLGHPQQQGEYHHHVNPRCLYDYTNTAVHSPIIGYSFDGYPIYGAWAFTFTNGTGPIKRMQSSYTTTTTTTRTNGPAVDNTYPVGCFMEDYVYTPGSGDLDDHNGRWCVTPEYPQGTYAYFATLNSSLTPEFPYTMYKTYYGIVQAGNTGGGSGHNTISESVTTYSPGATGLSENNLNLNYMLFPNPAQNYVHLFIDPIAQNNFDITVTDVNGKVVVTEHNIQPTIMYSFDLTKLSKGVYYFNIKNDKINRTEKILVN